MQVTQLPDGIMNTEVPKPTNEEMQNDDRFNQHDNNGERTQYYYRDHHEAIVSREKHDAANAIIDLNASEKGIRDNPEKYKKRYVYSGKIFCGE